MEVYTADEIAKIEFSVDAGDTYVNANLFDADSVSIDVTPVKSKVNESQEATAKKKVEVKLMLHDQQAAVKGALESAEDAFTKTRFKITLLDSTKNIVTRDKIINIARSLKTSEKLLGYEVTQTYEVDRTVSEFESEAIIPV
ncbi:MAG: hypothetical protein ABJI69_09260 [Balneola sp.]